MIMRLTFLGVSSALAVGDEQFNTNMLITNDSGKNLLIDCGYDIKRSLYKQGYSHTDVDAVYVSHLHADHVGGLEWLGFAKYFIDKNPPDLYVSREIKTALWNNVLSAGLSTLEDKEASLDTFFKVHALNGSFTWHGYQFKLVRVPHSINNGQHTPSFGLFITLAKQKIFITTDTRFCPDILMPYYLDADLILHDCETSQYSSGQHARYDDLKSLPTKIKAKMWLSDYDNCSNKQALQDGFAGFARLGQSFTLQ